MASQIDETVPAYGAPTTLSVRSNFGIAKTEITAIQALTVGGPFIPITGGTMRGPLLLNSDPSSPLHAATKDYVDTTVANEAIWRGIYHVAANFPVIDQPPPLNGYAWTCVTADPEVAESLTVNLAPIPAGTLIGNGDALRYSTSQGWVQISASSITIDIADARYVQYGGGTLSGFLTLVGAPTAPLHATTKAYVDVAVGNIAPSAAGAVQRVGDTMTGLLTLSGPPTNPSHAANKQYVDAADTLAVKLAGSVMTGLLTLSGSPSNPNHAATKQYVDTGDAAAVKLVGSVMTGLLALSGAPTAANHAATKAYVDNADALKANVFSPTFTGIPTAPTPVPGDNSTTLATTAYVKSQGFAPLASPAFTGIPTASTASPGNNTSQLATTAFVQSQIALKADIASPAFTGVPTAPTPTPGDNSNTLATTAHVKSQGFAPLTAPAFTGIPTAPTASPANNTAQLATTAFVQSQGYATTGYVQGQGYATTGYVQAQGYATTAQLGGYLPLNGGSMSGGITATGGFVSTGGAFHNQGPNAMYAFFARDTNLQWGWYALGTTARFWNPGYSDVLTIDYTGGGLTVSATFDPVKAVAPYGQYARMRSLVSGVRDWSFGTWNDGGWKVADETISSPRLIVDMAGSCYNTDGSWHAFSDARLKRDIGDYRRGLAEIVQLRPVEFYFNGKLDDGELHFGMIAQEVEAVMPELCGETSVSVPQLDDAGDVIVADPEIFKTVNPGRAIFALINAVKELAGRLDELEGRTA